MLMSGCLRWSSRKYQQDGGILKRIVHYWLAYLNMVGNIYKIDMSMFFTFCAVFSMLTALITSLLPGYEMYTTMRADPCLCFLERAGRPDDKAIDAEQHTGDAELGDE